IRLVRPVPFEQREFRVMQRAAFAVAERAREFVDPRLARGQELLTGELGRGPQKARQPASIRRHELGPKPVQVRPGTRGDLQHGGFDFHEIFRREKAAHRCRDAPAREQQRPAIGVETGLPKRRPDGHRFAQAACGRRGNRWNSRSGSLWCAPEPVSPEPEYCHEEAAPVKVIASSLRKGNIVDIDGKLYVILSAENIHPGKGTPVTQLDMRRISDGVKVSERYRTTEQVERAYVEDREYQFLYRDADGYHFMNS